MNDYRSARGPQGTGEPYGGGTPDCGSGFYIGLQHVPDHVVTFDPTLPLRQDGSCLIVVGERDGSEPGGGHA